MHISEFDYDLPEELIAEHPLAERDQSRLMVVNRADQTIRHDFFYNLTDHLPPASSLVFNNTKVIPARLLGSRNPTGGQVEVFVLKRLDDDGLCEVLMKPMRRIKNGEWIDFDEGYSATVVDRDARHVRFSDPDVMAMLDKIGHMPLPPYIQRPDDQTDRSMYQTVYAKAAGSVAAPTAGRHFTESLMKCLADAGHTLNYLTLHINYGTFKPVESESIEDHPMHSEEYAMDPKLWAALQDRRQAGHPVVAVGTTSCRVLESIARGGPLSGSTDLYIYPPQTMRMVDVLITNFHLPRSTLLMLISAFASVDLIRKAYQEAIEERYRFYSYGDSMLIL
jgi:S-adenosylmethionine:tRNA ribosyltransferase-isomerase